jgi:hypothetical protein
MAVKIPARVAARISTGLRKYPKVFQQAFDRDINESDTAVIIADFLSEVLGFDKYNEITTEFAIRGTYYDLAVKVGGQVRYLVEVKAIGIKLNDSHLRQAIQYAATHGVEWVILTNGASWQVHRMRFEQPVSADLVFDLDLLSATPRSKEVIERLFVLTREGVSKSAIQEFQQQKDASSPFLIAAVLQSDSLIGVLRRELRRISPGAKLSEDELRGVLIDEVLKREVALDERPTAPCTTVPNRRCRGQILPTSLLQPLPRLGRQPKTFLLKTELQQLFDRHVR